MASLRFAPTRSIRLPFSDTDRRCSIARPFAVPTNCALSKEEQTGRPNVYRPQRVGDTISAMVARELHHGPDASLWVDLAFAS
jgi:hypothetical protein